jgi:hypothetical protein
MEKRDILDWQDQKIGEMELPAGTPEHIWQEKLAKYKVPPVEAQPQE